MSVHVFGTMGTVVSLRYTGETLTALQLTEIENTFREFDREFSLYDAKSPLNRIAEGELTLAQADQSVRDAYALAIEWRNRTGGLFTPHRPDGIVDLSGVVKALAIQAAGEKLNCNCQDWLLTVGGDILSRGSHGANPWRIGVVDPRARDRLAGVVELHPNRAAVATSGIAERGEHIWRSDNADVVQATVAARDIVTADVLATALVAGDDMARLANDYDIDILCIWSDGSVRATTNAAKWLWGKDRS